MLVSLDFNNKNQYRKYPFKQSSSLISDNGYNLPDNLIVNFSISSTYGKHRIYVSQIHRKEKNLRIAVSNYFDDSLLGIFIFNLSEDFQSVNVSPSVSTISGNLTIGAYEAWLKTPTILNFAKDTSELEESTVFCFTPPLVTSIKDKFGQELRNSVNLGVLTNLEKTTSLESYQTSLQASAPESVTSLADSSSYLNNCTNPVIRNINGVTPFPASQPPDGNDGNIYIVGVLPITFYGITPEEGVITTTTEDITLDSLCSQTRKMLPPKNISGFTLDTPAFRDKYYSKPAFSVPQPQGSPPDYPYSIPERYASNFNSTNRPEYYYWPQFVKPEYYNLWATSSENNGDI